MFFLPCHPQSSNTRSTLYTNTDKHNEKTAYHLFVSEYTLAGPTVLRYDSSHQVGNLYQINT
jgi:hypothetical protein